MKYKKLEESDDTETADCNRIELAPLSPGASTGGGSSEGLTQGVQAGGHANGVATGGTLTSAMNDSGRGSYEESSDGSGSVEETSISVVELPLAVNEGNRGGEEWNEEDTANRQVWEGRGRGLPGGIKSKTLPNQ